MPSNRNQSEANANLLAELLGRQLGTLPPVNAPAPTPRRTRRSRTASATTAATVATMMTAAASATAPAPALAHVFDNAESVFAQSLGDTAGMESREVRAIELCARKMELLALQQAVQSELADLNREIERLKRSA